MPPAVVPPGDPLLADARASIRAGAVSPEAVARVMASDAPVHARARRLLPTIGQPIAAEPELPAPAHDGPSLKAPSLAAAPVDPVSVDPVPVPPAGAAAPAPKSKPAPPTPPPVASDGRATVSALKLAKSKKGATLTLRGTGKLMVGTANQLSSGVVHLVVDRASAGSAAVSARPSINGVAVTAVRKGQGTVQITLQLQPGWTLGPIRGFSGGARVTFNPPA